MDRALKERIIGAIVLVALVILVVPVFLDGPPNRGEIVSERVPLPGQSDQKTQTIVLERVRDEPLPAQPVNEAGSAELSVEADEPGTSNPSVEASEPAAVKLVVTKPPEKEPQTVAAQPTESRPAETVPDSTSPSTTSATGMFAVQLGSFSNQQNAEQLAADLRKLGFAAFLSQLSTSGGQLHRVRVGPQKDREAAEAMAQRLEKAGHKGKVLPHP